MLVILQTKGLHSIEPRTVVTISVMWAEKEREKKKLHLSRMQKENKNPAVFGLNSCFSLVFHSNILVSF
jgi:hypothetical protein